MSRVRTGAPSKSQAERQGAQGGEHRVQRGDTLSKIARDQGISLAQLLAANPQIRNPDRIAIGQVLRLPDKQAAELASAGNKVAVEPRAASDQLAEQRRGEDSKLASRDVAPSADARVGSTQSFGLTGLIASNKRERETSARPVGEPAAGPAGASPFGAELAHEVTRAAAPLSPTRIKGTDPLQLLGAVDDGDVVVEIPLRAGKYKSKGVRFKIEPNTVMRVQMQVRDGKLVPAKDRRGRDTGGGCKVEIDPPADLPLWLTGRGAYLRDRGKAQSQFKADIGGFFDLNISSRDGFELRKMVGSFADGSAAKPGRSKKSGKADEPLIPEGMLQFDRMRFEVGEVSLRDDGIELGGTQVGLAPGNRLHISGDKGQAELSGEVELSSLALAQEGLELEAGAGSAHIQVRSELQKDGSLEVKGRISDIEADILRYEAVNPRFKGDTAPDHVTVGAAHLHDSSVEVDLKLRPKRGTGKPAKSARRTRVDLQAEGELRGARLRVKDRDADARFEAGAGRFSGRIQNGAGTTRVDVNLQDTAWQVEDLQTGKGPAELDLHHLRVQGDTQVKVDTGDGTFEIAADAREIDLRVDDYRGRTATTEVDLAPTDVNGRGRVAVSKRGVEIDGALHVSGGLDDLKVRTEDGSIGLDVAKGSTVDADVTHLSATEAGFELDAKGAVDLGLEGYEAKLPGVEARGAAKLRGQTDLHIGQGQVFFTNADATVTVDVDDAKVAPGGAGFNLDAAAGSKLELNVEEAKFASKAEQRSVKLGPGSRLDAVLDGGVISVAGTRLDLAAGSAAQFEIDALDAAGGKTPTLTGKLAVEVDLKETKLDRRALDALPNVTLDEQAGARGRAVLTVDKVSLSPDGRFSLEGVGVDLRAHLDRLSGATTAPEAKAPMTDGPVGPADVAFQLPRAEAAGPELSPAGTRSVEDVAAASASEIAGAKVQAAAYHPLDTAKNLRDGTLEITIPVEGTLGEGYFGSADFDKGTSLKITAKVRNGRIDPKATKAAFSKSGDGALWVTAQGVEFDEDNTLRIKLGGWRDKVVPGMEKMPLNVGDFVERLRPAEAADSDAAQGAGKSSNAFGALQLDQMRVDIKDAAFKAGPLPIPGGHVDIEAGTRLSVSGTPGAATLRGRVDFSGAQLSNEHVALKSGAGSADLEIGYRVRDSRADVTTRLSNFDLDVEYAVHRRNNGDYLHLAEGQACDGWMETVTTFDLNDRGLPEAVAGVEVNLEVPSFKGRVEGARVTVPDADGETQIEIGRSAVEGEIRVDQNRIAVKGHIDEMDAAIRGLDLKGEAGAYSIDYARLQGAGDIDLSPDRTLKIEGDVDRVEMRASDLQSEGPGFALDAGRTLVHGSGSVSIDSSGQVALDGDLHVNSALDGARFDGTSIGQEGTVQVAGDSRFAADVSHFSFSKDGAFAVRGKGGVDFKIADFQGDVAGVHAEGDARLYGGGNFSLDSEQGIRLPPRMNLDVDVRDAVVESPDKGVRFDVAEGSRVKLRISSTELDGKGKPVRVELGPGTRIEGGLDSGALSLPGLRQPLQLSAGSTIDFAIDQMVADREGARSLEGRLSLEAVVDMRRIDLDALARVSGARLERIDDAQGRLRLDIERVRLNPDGSFELADAEVQLQARLGAVHGRYDPSRE